MGGAEVESGLKGDSCPDEHHPAPRALVPRTNREYRMRARLVHPLQREGVRRLRQGCSRDDLDNAIG